MKIKKIILADDDEDDRLFFKEALEELDDVELILVSSEIQLLSTLETLPLPDIIFLNKCFQQMNEFECIKKIKKHDPNHNIPIAIYSDTNHEHYVEEAYNAKANIFIPKPSSFEEIKIVLKKVFEIDVEEILPQPPRDKFVITP